MNIGKLTCCFCLFAVSISNFAYGNVETTEVIQSGILKKITKSSAELVIIEKTIGKESRVLSDKLNQKQIEIKRLREQAANAQRLMDEQLLSLDKLKDRVEKWSTQSSYQNHLLRVFVESNSLDKTILPQKDGESIIDASAIALSLSEIKNRLQPQWQSKNLVSDQGRFSNTSVLKLGPVEIAFDEKIKSGGPIFRSISGEGKILDIYTDVQQKQLAQLFYEKRGYFSFDPSQGSAYKLLEKNDSILAHLEKGGVWALPILVFGFLSLFIAILKSLQFVRLPRVDFQLLGKMQSAIAAIDFAQVGGLEHAKRSLNDLMKNIKGAQFDLVQLVLNTPPSQHRDDLLVACLKESKHDLEKHMGIVATSAAIAPLLGLLGTVSGMISTFKLMTIFGSGDASTVSGGISEALVTTELGLIVAIPSLVVSALLSRRTKSYSHALETFAIKVSKFSIKG